MEDFKCEILIIGSGPAGLSAGVYCGRANRNTIILEGKEPSALQKSKEIQNWLGEKAIEGPKLLHKFKKHVETYETVRITKGDVISLMTGMGMNMISTRTQNITSEVVIIATGRGHRGDIIKGESDLIGYGVSYCALCDGPLYKNKTVYLYGTDKEVIDDALILIQMGCTIKIISKARINELPEKINELKAKGIPIIERTEIMEAIKNAKGLIDKITCKSLDTGKITEYKLDALFIFSHVPSNSIFQKAGIELDEKGNIKVDENQQTNIEGVFAAGDVTGGIFQVIFAAAQGARAALNALKYLQSLKKD